MAERNAPPPSVPHAPLWREALLSAALSSVVCLILYIKSPGVFDSLDYFNLYEPFARHYVDAARGFRLPLWNPYIGLGRPFLADVETAVFYPLNFVMVLLGVHEGAGLLVLLHAALAGAGLHLLCRRMGAASGPAHLAAAAQAAGASLAGLLQSGQLKLAFASAHIPLILWLALGLQERFSRRRWALMAALLAHQFLAGHPQGWWIGLVGCAGMLAGRRVGAPWAANLKGLARDWVGLALAAALGLAVCGPQLLPFMELIGQGNRAAASIEYSAAFSMRWIDWSSLLIPVGGVYQINWEFNRYVGAVTLIAGLAGLAAWRDRDSRALAALALVGIVIAAGTRTPFFAPLYHLLPGLSSFRIPARTGVLVNLALLVSTARWLSREERGRGRIGALAIPSLLGVGVILWIGANIRESSSWHWVRLGVWGAAAALLIAREWPGLGGVKPGPRWLWGVAALLMVDLTTMVFQLKTVYRLPFKRDSEEIIRRGLADNAMLTAGAPPPRVVIPPGVRPNSGMELGWSTYSAYASQNLDRVWNYEHAVLGVAVPDRRNTTPSDEILKRGPFPYDSMALGVGYDPATAEIKLRPPADPRAYVAFKGERVHDWREAIERMKRGHPFHEDPLAESELALPPAPPDAKGSARIVSFAPERVVVETDASAPGLLVLAEAWYPGWRATVGGADEPCLPVNAWMRGVKVPAGPQRVEFYYRSRWLGWGWALGILSAAALAMTGSRFKLGALSDAGVPETSRATPPKPGPASTPTPTPAPNPAPPKTRNAPAPPKAVSNAKRPAEKKKPGRKRG